MKTTYWFGAMIVFEVDLPDIDLYVGKKIRYAGNDYEIASIFTSMDGECRTVYLVRTQTTMIDLK